MSKTITESTRPHCKHPRATQSYAAYLVGFGFLLFVSGVYAQTSIVAARNANEVSIGADSKRTIRILNRDGSVEAMASRTACKIHKANGFYFGCSGFCYEIKASEIVIRSTRGSTQPFERKVEASISQIQTALVGFTKQTREASAAVYAQRLQNGKPVLQLLFISLPNGIPSGIVVDFFSQSSDAIEVKMAKLSLSMNVLAIGHTDAIRNLTNTERASLDGLRPEEIVSRLVSVEIDKQGDEVGPPIDVLRVNKAGACWVHHKTEGDECNTDISDCSTAKSPPKPTRPRRKRGG